MRTEAERISDNPDRVSVLVTAPWQPTDTTYRCEFEIYSDGNIRRMDCCMSVRLLDFDAKPVAHDETPRQHAQLHDAAWPVAERAFNDWKEAQRDR